MDYFNMLYVISFIFIEHPQEQNFKPLVISTNIWSNLIPNQPSIRQLNQYSVVSLGIQYKSTEYQFISTNQDSLPQRKSNTVKLSHFGPQTLNNMQMPLPCNVMSMPTYPYLSLCLQNTEKILLPQNDVLTISGLTYEKTWNLACQILGAI